MEQTVYRIENRRGEGPYQSSGMSNFIYGMACEHRHTRPTPKNDCGIKRFATGCEQCGFESIKQLHRWFSDDELRMLKHNGFDIVTFTANITAVGKMQILFDRNTRYRYEPT